MRIWIDTDVGSDVDDALTLAYALRHPDLDLVGISTVFGDVALRSDIARAVLASADVHDVPILTGLGVPITNERIGLMFGHEGRAILDGREPRMQTREDANPDGRIEALAEALDRTKPEVLLAIGPLSNLGALVRRGVTLPPLAIMGGKLSDVMLEGMIPAIPEWNWYCDPVAVQLVIGANHATLPRIVPAEVTFRTALEPGDVETLAGGDALARQIAALSAEWLRFQSERFGSKNPRVALHDPLTAAVLVHDGLCPFEKRAIRVDDTAASECVDDTPNITTATDVDAKALRDHLMETWL